MILPFQDIVFNEFMPVYCLIIKNRKKKLRKKIDGKMVLNWMVFSVLPGTVTLFERPDFFHCMKYVGRGQ